MAAIAGHNSNSDFEITMSKTLINLIFWGAIGAIAVWLGSVYYKMAMMPAETTQQGLDTIDTVQTEMNRITEQRQQAIDQYTNQYSSPNN